MISVIHESGSSFKGLAGYLLHDKGRANTDERVAWTHTHNLATDDPELAWRIQAATSMQQGQLKQEAGVPNTGRKSKKHVMHYTLSWHPDERQELTRAEMVQAALASMTYVGTYEGEQIGKGKEAIRTQYADQHQALIVCHDEGEGTPPHIHVMLNRVHPEHGVMLPTTMEKNRLSKWALEYRQAQGKEDLCPQRVKNWAKKAEGIAVNNPRKPRHIYEQEKAANDADPGSRKKALLEQQRRKAAELFKQQQGMKQEQAEVLARLQEQHLLSEKLERQRAGEEGRQATSQAKEAFAPRIDALTDRQATEISGFAEAQKTFAGRVRNSWAALKTRQWMTEVRGQPLQATTHAFKLAFSSGMQERHLRDHHEQEKRRLQVELRRLEQEATRQARAQGEARLEERRRIYERERSDMLLQHEMDKARVNAAWYQLQQDRKASAAEADQVRKAEARREQTKHQEQERVRSEEARQQAQTARAQAARDAAEASEQSASTGAGPATADQPSEPSPSNDNTPAPDSPQLTPEYNREASPPPSTDTSQSEGDDRASAMDAFAKQVEQQSQNQGQGQDITD